MTNAESWDAAYGSHDAELDTDAAGVDALRREVAELRDLLKENLDAGESLNIQDNREFLKARAERDAKAAASADDPATLHTLRQIDNEADLVKFIRDNGGQ